MSPILHKTKLNAHAKRYVWVVCSVSISSKDIFIGDPLAVPHMYHETRASARAMAAVLNRDPQFANLITAKVYRVTLSIKPWKLA